MAWLRNKKTGGWFEIPDDQLKTNDYMNNKIRNKGKTIKGVGKTKKMEEADKNYKKAIDKADARAIERLDNEPFGLGKGLQNYKKAYKTAKTKKTNAYTYKMTDENRKKAVTNLGNKSTKLDNAMSNASGKKFDKLAKKYAKNQKKLKAIGGKYIIR